jgi:hypothetical protein
MIGIPEWDRTGEGGGVGGGGGGWNMVGDWPLILLFKSLFGKGGGRGMEHGWRLAFNITF